MRILSFNVNGLRSFSKKIGEMSFNDYLLHELKAEIVCIQEIKGTRESLAQFHTLKDYRTFSSFHSATGRHGVSTFVRKNLFCSKAVEISKGRILKTVHGRLVLYNCYLPFLDYGKATCEDCYNTYGIYDALSADLSDSSVIFCGDLNACYSMLDHYQYAREVSRVAPVKGLKVDSFTLNLPPFDIPGHVKCFKDYLEHYFGRRPDEACLPLTLKIHDYSIGKIEQSKYIERNDPGPRELPYTFFDLETMQLYFFSQYQRLWLLLLSQKYTDTFRMFNNELKKYTCWNTFLNNRPVNLGTRIDYIFCSKNLVCMASGIMTEVMGSDHCPLFADFDLVITGKEEDNIVLKDNSLLKFLKRK